jgi:hypothetical protein
LVKSSGADPETARITRINHVNRAFICARAPNLLA